MDGPWPQAVLYLGACAAPMSALAWTLAILSRQWLRNPVDQPAVFGFIAARVASWVADEGPTSGVLIVSVLLWGLVYYYPIAVLAIRPYGWLGRVIVVAYFLVQVI